MNRRKFFTSSAAVAALLPSIPRPALAVTPLENPILNVFRMLPAQPEDDEFDFPTTSGVNGKLQRSVWPENPEMYWDPEGEDYFTTFGFYPSWMMWQGTQAGVSLWQLSPDAYEREVTQQTLESNGWELVDDELRVLTYSGDEDDRERLAGSLNLLGSWMRDGEWDWIALPDSTSVIVGSDESRVQLVTARLQNRTTMSSMYDQFGQLRWMLRMDSYRVSLLPPQRLPVANFRQAFLSRSWTGNEPIIQSIGLCLESDTHAQTVIDTVRDRLETESSVLLDSPYAGFLEILNIVEDNATIRFDLVDSSGEWDVFRALNAGDLLMLPPA